MSTTDELDPLRAENDQLRSDLAEAAETLRAIRAGEVDAVVVHTAEGDRIFALENAYELYRRFIEHMQEGALALNADGVVLYANHSFVEMIGIPHSRLVGAYARDVLRGTNAGLVDAALNASTGENPHREIVLTRDDGAQRHALVSMTMMPDRTRCVVVRDVSELKASQAALSGIEWMLTRRVLERSHVSPQPCADLTVLNRERTILNAVGVDLLEDIVADYTHLLETASVVHEKNGDYAFAMFSSEWCRTLHGASFRLCGTDDAGAALQSGRWRCHEGCWNDAARVAIETGHDTDVACPGGIRLYAVPIHAAGEVVGSISFGYGDPPRDPDRLHELAGAFRVSVEELRRAALAYESRPPFIVDLAKERLHGSARLIGEIVQRRRAQQAVGEMNSALEQRVSERTAELTAANKELEAFSYSVSHDLRGPLRAMSGFSQMILEDYGAALPDGARRYLDQITRASRRMGELIDGLLTLSRCTRGELRPDQIDLSAMCLRLRDELAADQPERQVEWHIEPGLNVRGDSRMIEVVMRTLLNNAWKFTAKKSSVVIRVYAEREEANRNKTFICVADNGAGFDMRFADKLFVPFERLHRQDEFPGTGVGLATAQRIIHRHGGTITATARAGEGATFRFSLS